MYLEFRDTEGKYIKQWPNWIGVVPQKDDIDFPEAHASAYPLCYKAAMEMAAWKQEQMIEKAVMYLSTHMLDEAYGIVGIRNFIADFKKVMEAD